MRNLRQLSSLFTIICLLGAAFFTQTSQADVAINYACSTSNLVYARNQGSASSSWVAQTIWATNLSDTLNNVTANLTYPVPGNTYFLTNNGIVLTFGSNVVTHTSGNSTATTLMRNVTGSGTSTIFPGDSLTLNTNTQIRLKLVGGISSTAQQISFLGVNGNPGLIMNGGIINDGDDGVYNIQGKMQITTGSESVFAPGGNFGNYTGTGSLIGTARSIIFGCQMSGQGTLDLVLTATNIPVLVTNGLNTFNGNWVIQEGWLIGTTPQCLGSANITVDPNATLGYYSPGMQLENRSSSNSASYATSGAILDFDYPPICTGTLILTNGGLMNLHTNCIFGSLIIEGTPLGNGHYTYSNLTVNPYQFTNFMPNTGGTNSYINIQTPVAPPAPIGLSAVPGTNSVVISWFPAATATGYIISRSTVNGGPYTQVGTTNSTTYIDSGLTQFQTYYYVVQGSNPFGAGPNSSQVSATPSPAVTGVTATVNPASVGLTWNSYTYFGGATNYTVTRGTILGGLYTIIFSGTSTNYTDSAVANGTFYYYVVLASLTNGALSAPSPEVSALTYPSVPAITTDLYGTSGIFLQLSAPDPQIPGYLLNGSSDGIHFSPLATLQGGTNNFFDTGLNEGTEYYFNVQATNSSGASAVSAVVSNSIPVGTISVAFGTGYANPVGNIPSPAPPGYIQDIGFAYGDQGNGIYGWATNMNVFATNSAQAAYDMSALGQGAYNNNNPPGDLRRDSFIHQTQDSEATNFAGLPASSYPFWAMANIPNGLYQVRVVSGDATATDSIYQQTVNGVTTPAFTPGAGNPYFAQWIVVCQVTNNILTVAPASTNNDKINYIDIYTAVLPAALFTYGPASGTAPLAVNFTNNSTGAYTTSFWSFDTNGDTLVGTNQVVSFTYTNAGTFTVSLVVSNNFGNASTNTVANAITVTPGTRPIITITNGPSSTLVVNWSGGGQLLQATNLPGPWTTNIGATAPFTVSPTNSRMFFRIQQ
jgi:PKD repeat protein